MNISGIVTNVRISKNVRITGVRRDLETSAENYVNDGEVSNLEYGEKNIAFDLNLENNNSNITLAIDVTNIGNVDVGLLSISGLPQGLDYSFANYTLKDKICNSNNECKLGITKTILLNIFGTPDEYSLNLTFNFERYYSVTYTDILGNYPTEVLEGDTFVVDLTGNTFNSIDVYQNQTKLIYNTDYTINNMILNIPNIEGNIEIRKVDKNIIYYLASSSVPMQSLPIEYQPVSYIESTGTQYINTGYYPKTNTRVEMDLEFVGNFRNTNHGFIGSVDMNNNSNFSVNFGGTDPYRMYFWINKRNGYGSGVKSSTYSTDILYNRNTMILDRQTGVVTYGNTTFQAEAAIDNVNDGLKIFASSSSVPFQAYNMKLYKFIITEDNVVQMNLVPCYRISDGKTGLYDIKNNNFYPNLGTGEFDYDGVVEIISTSTFYMNQSLNVIPNAPIVSGSSFVEWNTLPDGSGISYNEGDTIPYSIMEGTTMGLYAIYDVLSGYQPVKYIKSTGTQYIDTGYRFTGGTAELEIKFSLSNVTPARWNANFVAGSRNDTSPRNYFLGIGVINASSSTYLRATSGETLIDNGIVIDTTPNVDEVEDIKLTIDDNNKTLTLLNKGLTTSMAYSGSAINSYNYILFGLSELNNPLSSCTIYSASIKDNGTLVRNFIPCYRRSDNVAGMCDTVNNIFYTNAGSGTFGLPPE